MRRYTKLTAFVICMSTCLFVTEKSFGDESLEPDENVDYTLCEGSGEKCVITYKGVGNPFDKKGKNKSAIVIKL